MFKKLFNKDKKESQPKFAMTEDYKKWRTAILGVKPEQAGISSAEKDRVFGVLMDFGMVDQKTRVPFVLTTTAFANGEASFRPSPGGGSMGLGNVGNLGQAAQELVKLAQGLFAKTQPTSDTSLPAPGYARFIFLTTSGIRLYEVHINELQKQGHPFFEMLRGFSYIRQFAEKMIDQQKAQKT